jgi:uncharacterized membrane protein
LWKKISTYYSPFVDVLSFLILILTAIYVIFQYGRLPDEIPQHFNIAGEPDAWGGKGFLIGLLVLYGFILSQAFILNYFLIISQKPKESMQFVNMPFIKKESLTETQVKMMKRNMARMLAMINLLISFMFSWMLYRTIQTAMERESGLGSGIMIFILIILLLPFYYIWKTYRIAKGRS